jgi:hypothetical protein
MPKVDPRNELGAILHAELNRVLSEHTGKNIYGNVNYAKTFLQGTVVNVFDGRAPGGKNAIWKLTVDFEMHYGEPTLGVELKRVTVHRQHCTLGPVLAGKKPKCSINFTDSIGEPDHAVKGSTTYLPNAKGRAATSSTIAAASTALCVSLSPASHIAETAGDEIEVIIVPPALTPMDATPHAATRTKNKSGNSHSAPAGRSTFPTPKVGLPPPPPLPLPPQLLASRCRWRITSQRLRATRLRSSSCPLPSPQWTRHLTPPRGQRRRERRPRLRLLLQPQPTMHRLKRQRQLLPPPQRRARRPARRSPPSPSTFGHLRCLCRRPTSQCIASGRLPTSKMGRRQC